MKILRKLLWLGGILFALFLAFTYLPLPGLDSSTERSVQWRGQTGHAANSAARAEEHFNLILASTNLKRPFPEMPRRADNPATPEKIELGKLLYFDPLLSADNDISCAHCHHPDLGFSDNRGQSMGRGGKGIGPQRAGGAVIRRGAPTIWNAAYNHLQFWDGRARDLEAQAGKPIQDQNEMAQDSTELVKELLAIPKYVHLFEKAFGGSNGATITFERVTYAIAAFERTILSRNSKFDRYADGEVSALSPDERRGFNLLRSLKTRCFECHNLPAFANPDFKVIGVPPLPNNEPDSGRAEVAGKGYANAFKVPTLRNVALTAPYMHNGVFRTLEDVLDFYSAGGGPGRGLNVPNVDDKIRKFDLSRQDKEDLIAFLHALTDESNKPEIPRRVPSGLPVVPALPNQSLEMQVFKTKAPEKKSSPITRAGKRLIVQAGESIQAGIDGAQAGDTVAVMPGVYHETLTVDIAGLTLLGIEQNGKRPVLEGKNILSDGLIGSGRNFEMRFFDIKNYTANGVMLNGAVNVKFRDLYCENPGLYGVYPVECINVLVERCTVTGVRDAGIYVGQSRDIVVRDCKAYANVTGIEIENSVNALVENNEAYNNAAGILVFLLPNNPSKVSQNCKVVNNRIYANNHENFGDPNAIVSQVPPGVGVLILAADEVEVTQNEIRDNNSVGVAVLALDVLFGQISSYDVDPAPERCWIHGNQFSNNGAQPAGMLKKIGLSGNDLLWDLSGNDNNWHQPGASKLPALLPDKNWPDFARRANWRLWKVLAKIAG